MSDDQQPVNPFNSAIPANPWTSANPATLALSTKPRHRHRRTALAAAGALTAVIVLAGPVHAEDAAGFLLSAGGLSTPFLSSNSSTVASSVTGAIVDIVSTAGYQNSTSAGTGMILSSSGEILTNNHVVDGATSLKVTVVSTGRTYDAKVVGTDPTDDVAVIQLVGASGLKTIPIGDSRTVQVGQKVVAQGNAGGVGGAPSVVSGSVTALNQGITASSDGTNDAEHLTGLIQTNAPIVAGDSGGPLATTSGKVIGMNTAASTSNGSADIGSMGTGSADGSTSNAESYAIPIRAALTIAHQIETGQASSTVHIGARGFLGVQIQSAASTGYTSGSGRRYSGGFGGEDFGDAQGYGGYSGDGNLDQGGSATSSSVSGAVVGGVISGGAAASTDLTAGDVITSVNGQKVDSATTLDTVMASTKAGQKVSIKWTDANGQNHTATVTLGAAAAD